MTKKFLIIAGCSLEFTPVIRAHIEFERSRENVVTCIEYRNYARMSFLWKAVKQVFSDTGYSCVICVNQQSLPILFLLSHVSKLNLVYWKLESVGTFDDWGIASKMNLFEWIMRRDRIHLIVPSKQRLEAQKPAYSRSTVVHNAPISPFVSVQRTKNDQMTKLVLYGNIFDETAFYIHEWLALVANKTNLCLTIIGKSGKDTRRTRWLDTLPHVELLKRLCDVNSFHYSIIGYRETNLNTKLAAPNKLIESLCCGLPVIGHSGNPYVVEIINRHRCGVIGDFNSLSAIRIEEVDYSVLAKNAIEAGRKLCLSTCIDEIEFG